MLKPEYIESLPDNLVELYAKAEADILSDMARRISTYDYFIPAAQWQYKKAIEMGIVHDEILKRLADITGKSKEELKLLMSEAGMKAIEADDEIYKKVGKNPLPIGKSEALSAVLTAGVKNTQGLFDNLTRTTANTATKQFEHALDRAYMQIVTGAFDYNTSVRQAIKSLASNGVGAIEYPTGHIDTIEVAVRRATVTGVNQTAAKMQEARADEMESDLVETTAHGGARPEHAEWQGKVFSRSGKSKKYPDFVTSTGYGTGAGLCGWNCRHNFYPYFEGMPRAYTPEMLADYDAKKHTYNGQKMTEYEATQKQRYIERQIRRWKRENLAMEAGGMDTAESAAKVSEWGRVQKDYLQQTGLKRQRDREQVGKVAKVVEISNKNDIIKVHKTLPTATPNVITEVKTSKGGTSRNYYGGDGKWQKQITNNNHGNPKNHPYGKNGEHAHDIIWEDDKIVGRPIRELTESERKENGDIL